MQKRKNNRDIVRWILLGVATLSVIIGFIICVKKKFKPSEIIPSITGFFTLAATLILDGKNARKSAETRYDNDVEDVAAKGNVTIGSGNRRAAGGRRNESESGTGLDKYSGKIRAKNIKAGGDVTVGDNNEI